MTLQTSRISRYSLIGAICFVFSWFLSKQFISVCGDYTAHIQFAKDAITTGQYPPHFLFHWLINLFSGFSGDLTRLQISTLILLSTVMCLKLFVSVIIMDHLLKAQKITITFMQLLLISFGLFVSGPIINWWQFPIIYKGQFSANVWHNPTTILLMPFAVIFLWIMMKRDNKPNTGLAILGSFLTLLSTLCKPNWTMILLPTLFILALIKKFSWKEWLIYALPAVFVLIWQFAQNYTSAGHSTNIHYKSHIVFNPFLVWYGWTKTPFGSLLVSLAFSLSFLYWFWREIKNRALMTLAWMLMIVSLGLFFMLAETGEKTFHGNFFWGTVPSLYLVFLLTITELISLQIPKTDTKNLLKRNFCWFLFALHILCGLFFLYRVYYFNDYYA